MSEVLILIDIQNDFITGSLPVPDGQSIISPVNQLITEFGHVIATQDWHPENHFSFFTQHKDKKAFDAVTKDDYIQTLWPPHCVQGSSGANFCPELHTNTVAAIFRKGMDPNIDSYSAFFDNNKLNNTGLHGFLQDKGITELVFCGLAGNFCVAYSANDAKSLGYKVSLFDKGIRSIN